MFIHSILSVATSVAEHGAGEPFAEFCARSASGRRESRCSVAGQQEHCGGRQRGVLCCETAGLLDKLESFSATRHELASFVYLFRIVREAVAYQTVLTTTTGRGSIPS